MLKLFIFSNLCVITYVYFSLTDDNGKSLKQQALKFASLAQVTPLAALGTADIRLRDFGHAFPVDLKTKTKKNNDVSNGMIMTKAEHKAKTRPKPKPEKSGPEINQIPAP